jgi:hypothetical protein
MGVFRERRRAPREPAGIPGRYLLTRRRELGWHDCSLLDVSELGAGGRFRGPNPEIGDEILILFDECIGPSPRPMRAIVRHARADYFGATRAGIEFAGLNAEHREVLVRLLRGDVVSELAKRARSTAVPITYRVY